MPYSRNNYNPANAMPVWQAPAPSGVITPYGKWVQTVEASQTDVPLGSDPAIGDYLSGFLLTPLTTAPGALSVKTGSGSYVILFVGGAGSVLSLAPIAIPYSATAIDAGWYVKTGVNMRVSAFGNWTVS